MNNPIYFSSEARWFFPEPPDDSLFAWFRSLSNQDIKPDTESRSDHYLLLPSTDMVGVKLRGISNDPEKCKFEIKAASSPSRPFILPNGVSGRTDQWIKWSFENSKDTGLNGLNRELLANGKWVELNKTRWLRKFDFDSDRCVEVPSKSRPQCGCNLELTQIKNHAGQHLGTSVGFEAFGPLENSSSHLFTTMSRFLCGADPTISVRFCARNSLNYPAWLSALS